MHIFSEVQLKCNKLDVFKALNFILFDTCTHHQTIGTIKAFSITPNSVFLSLCNPCFPPPHPQATRALLSVTINLFPFLRTLHKWNHALCVFFGGRGAWLFTQHNDFEIYPHKGSYMKVNSKFISNSEKLEIASLSISR